MQIVIIGGGVVGLNIALELCGGLPPLHTAGGHALLLGGLRRKAAATLPAHEIYLLEQEKFLGHHTSTRNSEVIHAGLAYPPESLKAKLCVEGNALTYELLGRLNVPYKKCGKWVIACGKAEDGALDACIKNAKVCGSAQFEHSSITEFYKAEPSAYNVTSAAFSASSGIIDAAAYIRALEVALSEHSNVNIIYPCKVTGIDEASSSLETTRGPIKYDLLINSAGLWADEIHSMICRMEDFQMCAGFQIIPFKGEYYTWRKGKVQMMIYPVPSRFVAQKGDPTLVSSMGIHIHRNIAGELFVGPSQVKLTPDKKSDYSIETPPEIFAKGLAPFIKDIRAEDLEPAYAGNRPKLYKYNQPIGDFQIFREKNVIHLMGMESPALTAAPAIAKYVNGLI